MLSSLYRSLNRVTEKIHDPMRPRARVLSRRAFTRAMALVAFGGVARPASPQRAQGEIRIRSRLTPGIDVRSPLVAGQEPLLRGEVDWVVGGVLDGDPAYLFDDVEALAQDAEGRVYVADSGSRTVRVFEHRGSHLYSIGGPGEGPGEFRISRLCGLAFDLDGRLWVNQLISFEIFDVGADGAAYFGSFAVRDGALRQSDVRRTDGRYGSAQGDEHLRREERARSGDNGRQSTGSSCELSHSSGFRRMGMAHLGGTVSE